MSINNDLTVLAAGEVNYAKLTATAQLAAESRMLAELTDAFVQLVRDYQPEIVDGDARCRIVVAAFPAFEQFKGAREMVQVAQKAALDEMYDVAREFGCPMGDNIADWLRAELGSLRDRREFKP